MSAPALPFQPAVLAAVPSFGRFLTFDLVDPARAKEALLAARAATSIARAGIGIGEPLALALGKKIEGLRSFPAVTGPGVSFPSTQGALWVFLAGDDPGDILDRALALTRATAGAFALSEDVPTFKYREGRDLSGYVDGTENPV